MELGNISALDLIGLIIVCISVFSTVYFNNKKMEERNKEKFDKKADSAYVDQQDKALHHRIDEIKTDNDNDFKEILAQLREIRKYILNSK
jgi:hypothetical protein